MARTNRAPREHLLCTACEWRGLTPLGRVRLGIWKLSTALVAALVVAEFVGLTALGGDLWTAVLIIAYGSIAIRLVIRGDRCPRCGERAIYVKRPPPVDEPL